jgi:hypothetical protein
LSIIAFMQPSTPPFVMSPPLLMQTSSGFGQPVIVPDVKSAAWQGAAHACTRPFS